MADQMDLLREQAKMLAGEVGFCTSSLKRMAEQAAVNPDDVQFQVYIHIFFDSVLNNYILPHVYFALRV